MGPSRLHQPGATLAGREMMWQSTSKGSGTAFIASTCGLGRAVRHGTIYVSYANSDAPGRHLAQATLSQSDENREMWQRCTMEVQQNDVTQSKNSVVIH